MEAESIADFSSFFSFFSISHLTQFEVGMHNLVNMTATRDFKVFSWSLLIDCLTENSTRTERRIEILSEKH